MWSQDLISRAIDNDLTNTQIQSLIQATIIDSGVNETTQQLLSHVIASDSIIQGVSELVGKSITRDEAMMTLVALFTEGAVGIVQDEAMVREIQKVMTQVVDNPVLRMGVKENYIYGPLKRLNPFSKK